MGKTRCSGLTTGLTARPSKPWHQCFAMQWRQQTVHQALPNQNWILEIRGGLSVKAISEYLIVWAMLDGIIFTNDQTDQVFWRWSTSGAYTARSAYKALHLGSIPFDGDNPIWKTWAPLKVKIILWLAFKRGATGRQIEHDATTLK